MRAFHHAYAPGAIWPSPRGSSRSWALATWALISDRQPAPLGAAGVRAGVHRLQLHRAPARGGAPHDLRAPPPAAERLLGWLYAVPSGISASQFTRWHLDHHAELGSDEDDPKRHHLSPKINARWFKLLYCVAGALPDLLPRRAEGERDLSAGAAAADRVRAQGVDRGAPRGAGAASGTIVGAGAAARAYSCRSSSSSRSRSR